MAASALTSIGVFGVCGGATLTERLTMAALPGWLTKRARDGGFTRIVEVMPPAGLRAQAIYLLTGVTDIYELHVVDDAMSGIDGVTIPLTRREAFALGSRYLGALSSRVEGVEVAVTPMFVPVCNDRSAEGIVCTRHHGHDGTHQGENGSWWPNEVAPEKATAQA